MRIEIRQVLRDASQIDLIGLSGVLADSFALAIFTSGRANDVEGRPF